MKNKKLKYILIFIFIVCLLIPISCIEIFATSNSWVILLSDWYSAVNIYSNITFNHLDYLTYTDYNNSTHTINGDNTIALQFYYYSSGSWNYYYINNSTVSSGANTYVQQIDLYYYDYITISYNKGNSPSYINYTSQNWTSGTTFTNEDVYLIYQMSVKNKQIATLYDKSFQIKFVLHPQSSSISFDKTYNLSFYNNDILYDSITISGASASGYAPFEEISQIKYGNTIVYDNSVWSSGYSSILRYNQLMTQPNVSTINSDCNSIITFTTQSFVATESITNRYQLGTFYNDSSGDVPYSDIYITGTVAVGTTAPFITISEIKYNNTSVYLNGSFYSGYSSTLYSYSNNPLNLTTINSDVNNIVTFINLSLGTYVPLNDILSGIAGVFGVTTTLIASAQTNWVLAIFMAMSVFMLLVLVIFKFVRGNSSGGSK